MPERILITTIMRPEGDTGVQTHFRAYAAYLTNHHHPVRLVTPYDSPKWQVYPIFALRRLIDLFSGTASVWWYRHWHAVFLFAALRQALADGLPCVVYAQCPLSADVALRARLTPQQRVVMVVHFNISQADEWVGKGAISDGGRLFYAIRQFEAEVLPRLDGLIFVSDFMHRELASRIPAIESIPFRVVPNFLRDPGMVEPNIALLTDLVCIGTLEPRKNQQYALEIVAASKRIGHPLHLTLVGDGPDRAFLEDLCQKLDIEKQVNFAGYVKNASCLLSQHRVCLHVALVENFPLTLVEALAYGTPIFASAVGGVPEVFRDGEEGRFIPLDDAESAARLIVEWLNSETTMGTARISARKRYLECFEANNVAAKLTEFLVV